MCRPGIEPRTTAWKAAMLTITSSTHLEIYSSLKPEIILLNQKYRYKKSLHRPGIQPRLNQTLLIAYTAAETGGNTMTKATPERKVQNHVGYL